MSNKDEQPWFVARESGTSYVPATWQGYVVMIAYILLICLSSLLIFKSWVWFFGACAVVTVIFFVIVGMKSSNF